MIEIIVAGHGKFAAGMAEAAGMIYGDHPNLTAISFENKEGIEDLKNHYRQKLKEFPPQTEVLFLIDIFGGSPYNAAIQLAYGHKNIEVLTGVNLPILLEALNLQHELDLSASQLAHHLKNYNSKGLKMFSEEIRKPVFNQGTKAEDDLS
ncbi:PTS sugar transporter subunit IIA [Liquorilactobacillus sicerae]|uniref:PTS sugar transporter subunit IIA n=1 Tax=Liquorilactobacillus sicerae TaxID=1416943 RepID=UPI0024803547|nr:mannose/fructose/sorbose PTS transporter subunit IIA [Liquorilactobacillus sicerae]